MKPDICSKSFRFQQGLTLLEVMVAVSILAVIAVLSYQALDVATDSSEISQERLAELKLLDRTWILMENDLRNALAYDKKPAFGDNIPAMQVGGQEYWLIFLRGGHANPLNLVRSELMRVAYRIDDEVLWRYSWTDPHSIDEDSAQKQKLMEGVEEVAVRVLSPDATSFSGGPWTDTWPAEGVTNQLPKAIEITLTFTKAGELMRLMALAPGN